MCSASSSPTGSTATKLLRSGHSRRSVSTGDPGGLIEGFRRHGPPQGRLIWLSEQSTAARVCAPSCSSMKSPASYRGLMAKRSCPAATLWPLPRPQKRERRRRGEGAQSAPKALSAAPRPRRSPGKAKPVRRRRPDAMFCAIPANLAASLPASDTSRMPGFWSGLFPPTISTTCWASAKKSRPSGTKRMHARWNRRRSGTIRMDCSVSRQQTSTSNSLQLCALSGLPVAKPIRSFWPSDVAPDETSKTTPSERRFRDLLLHQIGGRHSRFVSDGDAAPPS